jgi:hypothetical protein
MKKYLLYLLLTISPTLFGQKGELRGRIFHPKQGEIAFASIQIESLQKGVITNEKGEFILTDIPYGEHTLQVSSIEIISKRIKILLNEIYILKY